MQIVNQSLLALWYVAIAFKALVVVSFVRKRLWLRYPAFTVGLGIEVLISAFLVGIWLCFGQAGKSWWTVSRSATIFITAAWVTESYMIQAIRCRRFLVAGTVLAALFAGFGFLAAWAAKNLGREPGPGADPMMWCVRNFDLIAVVFLIASSGWFRYARIRLASNIDRHVWILILWLTGEFVSYGISYATGYWWSAFGVAVMHVTEIAAYIAWMMTPPSGEREPDPDGDGRSRDFRSALADIRDRADRMRCACY